MRTRILAFIIEQVLRSITPVMMKELADKLLDLVEDAVQKSPNTVDDKILILTRIVRATFGIDDK